MYVVKRDEAVLCRTATLECEDYATCYRCTDHNPHSTLAMVTRHTITA